MAAAASESRYLLHAVPLDTMDLWPPILNKAAIVSSHFISLHYSFMLILIDEDTLKKGGVEEYFNCLVSNSCESIVHTGRVFLKRNVNLHIFPFAFLTEIWEVEHKQCFRYISDHHRWCISHCNQPGKSVLFFLMKKVLRLLQSLFYIFTSYSSAN